MSTTPNLLSLNELPYLTHDIPGIGGRIKTRPEDFIVEEVPLYEPAGDGTHVYFRIEKTGLTTMQAVQQIARALNRPPRDIGYAGLKDADALTSQMLSIEHVDPQQVRDLQIPRINVVYVSRHRNKLKLGHLAGNRFIIKLRDLAVPDPQAARAVLDTLQRVGVPNYFGPQRFGTRGDTWQIGRALLHGDHAEALALMLGRPGPSDYGGPRKARELFDAGQYEEAARHWPYPFYNERRICHALVREKGNAKRAFRTVDPQMRRFYISAFQSHLFNQVVAARINSLNQLQPGDLAWRHPQGAVFLVEDVAREQPRCDAFEISPTGPLYGHRMTFPQGAQGALEQALLDAQNLQLDSFSEGGKHPARGGRRPLRFQPADLTVDTGRDDAGDFLRVSFQLESGCYATTVLRELCKWREGFGEGTAEEPEE